MPDRSEKIRNKINAIKEKCKIELAAKKKAAKKKVPEKKATKKKVTKTADKTKKTKSGMTQDVADSVSYEEFGDWLYEAVRKVPKKKGTKKVVKKKKQLPKKISKTKEPKEKQEVLPLGPVGVKKPMVKIKRKRKAKVKTKETQLELNFEKKKVAKKKTTKKKTTKKKTVVKKKTDPKVGADAKTDVKSRKVYGYKGRRSIFRHLKRFQKHRDPSKGGATGFDPSLEPTARPTV